MFLVYKCIWNSKLLKQQAVIFSGLWDMIIHSFTLILLPFMALVKIKRKNQKYWGPHTIIVQRIICDFISSICFMKLSLHVWWARLRMVRSLMIIPSVNTEGYTLSLLICLVWGLCFYTVMPMYFHLPWIYFSFFVSKVNSIFDGGIFRGEKF